MHTCMGGATSVVGDGFPQDLSMIIAVLIPHICVSGYSLYT